MDKDFRPQGNKYPTPDSRDYVRGVTSPIPYVVRNPTGDWSEDFGPYQPQKFKFDTNSCWCISGIHCVEDQLDFLYKRGSFPETSVKWFKTNGYINEDNVFQVSWRFIYTLSGAYGNGNSQWEFWRLLDKYGIIPIKDFDFTMADSMSSMTPEEMWRTCGDPTLITPEMIKKAKEFKKYVSVAYEWIGNLYQTPNLTDLRATLLQSPIQIGVPACLDTWNSGRVLACGRQVPDHAVELYKIDTDGTYYIFDQYEPHLKTLSPDYPILMATNGVISPIITYADIPNVPTYPQNSFTRMWAWVKAYLAAHYG